MRYTATIKRSDGTESTYVSMVDTTNGDAAAVELARNTADSYGHELVSLKDADGKEVDLNG